MYSISFLSVSCSLWRPPSRQCFADRRVVAAHEAADLVGALRVEAGVARAVVLAHHRGHGERGQTLAQPWHEVERVGHLGPADEGDHHRRHLAEAIVGQTDGAGVADGGMGPERALDVPQVDLEAAADDDVIHPAEDPHEPVVVDARPIGRAQPAGRQPDRPLRWVDLQHAFAIRRPRVTTGRVHHPKCDPGMGSPDTAELGHAELLPQRRRPAGHAVEELRRAVPEEHRNAVAMLEGAGDRWSDRARRGHERSHPVEVIGRYAGIEDHLDHRRRGADDVGTVLPHQRGPRAHVEPFHHRHWPPHEDQPRHRQ